MKNYRQLDQVQRYKIETLLEVGLPKSKIAEQIGVHKSTVYRELNRNTGKRGRHAKEYLARLAQTKSDKRHTFKRKSVKFTQGLKQQAKGWLKDEHLSPELIAVEWKKRGVEGVSHEWLYQWIWYCKKSNRRKNKAYKNIYRYLLHGKRRHKRGNYHNTRGTIKDRVSIEKRPGIVDKRTRLGDIEVDLMLGVKSGAPLLVMTDRTTLITKMDKLKSKNANQVKEVIQKRIKNIGSSWIKTLTFDNGKEFAAHKKISDHCDVKTYFTRPYTSQDKGSVENRIGLIRRWLPKGKDLTEVSHKRIKEIEMMVNNRRIRKFDYISPIDKLKSTWPVALIT